MILFENCLNNNGFLKVTRKTNTCFINENDFEFHIIQKLSYTSYSKIGLPSLSPHAHARVLKYEKQRYQKNMQKYQGEKTTKIYINIEYSNKYTLF